MDSKYGTRVGPVAAEARGTGSDESWLFGVVCESSWLMKPHGRSRFDPDPPAAHELQAPRYVIPTYI